MAKAILLSQIRIDGGTQSRATMDQATVDDYAEHIDALPPADVYHDGEHHWLADGFYRFHAHAKLNRESMACVVHKGTLDDAKWHAAGANKSHGLRRTNEDKASAVRLALSLSGSLSKSDIELAEHCGVSDRTVAKYRSELTPKISESGPKAIVRLGSLVGEDMGGGVIRVGKDGIARQTSSANRSEAAKESAAKKKEALRDRLHGPVKGAWDANELTVAQAKKLAELRPMLQKDELDKIRAKAARTAKANAPSTQVVAGHKSESGPKPTPNEKPKGAWAPYHKLLGKLVRTIDECASASGMPTNGQRIKAVHHAFNEAHKLVLALERGR